MELDRYRSTLGGMAKDAGGDWVKLDDALQLVALANMTSIRMMAKLMEELSKARAEIDNVLQSTSHSLLN